MINSSERHTWYDIQELMIKNKLDQHERITVLSQLLFKLLTDGLINKTITGFEDAMDTMKSIHVDILKEEGWE